MKTNLSEYSVKDIIKGFIYNELEGKGLFGLSGHSSAMAGSPASSPVNGMRRRVASWNVTATRRRRVPGRRSSRSLASDRQLRATIRDC